MNEHKQIDWLQVVPGKTYLKDRKGNVVRVDTIKEGEVWLYHQLNGLGYHFTLPVDTVNDEYIIQGDTVMKNDQRIDWSQVIPGQTWLESPNGCLCRVDAIVGEDVWVYYRDREYKAAHHISWTKSSIEACKWRIREEWEDITKDCYFEWDSFYGESRDVTSIFYRKNGLAIRVDSKQDYKLKGRRVYKRRTH